MIHDGFDRYGSDVFASGWRDAGRRAVPQVAADIGTVIEVAGDGFCGAVTRVQSGAVELEDRLGKRRLFPLGGGFLIDGEPVLLGPPFAHPRRGPPRRRTRREGVGR